MLVNIPRKGSKSEEMRLVGERLGHPNLPGGRYSQKPLEFTSTLDLKVASNLS